MSRRASRFNKRSWRWFVCCLMVIALPVCGLSTLLSALLGPVHFHEATTAATTDEGSMTGWHDFRRLSHVADSMLHVHDHSDLGRHHHDRGDTGLVTVGAGDHGEDAAGAPATAATIVLAVGNQTSVQLLLRSTTAMDWSAPLTCRFRSCDLRRLDRPPIV